MTFRFWFTNTALLVGCLLCGCPNQGGGGGAGNDNGHNNSNDNGMMDDGDGSDDGVMDDADNDGGGAGDDDPAPGGWTEVQEFFASDPEAGDRFGTSLAWSGDTVIVGANSKDDNQGAVYVYRRSGDTYQFESKLVGEDIFNPQSFGQSVAILGDTAFVGASNYAPEGSFEFQIGGVYVFQRTGTTWQQTQLLVASDAQSQDYLGTSIAIDNDVLVAGAFGREDLTGVVYVFRNIGGVWTEEASFTGDDTINFNYFGESVAISSGTIVVGAAVQERGTGAAYVFEQIGGVWSQTAKLLSPEPSETDQFGSTVEIEGDTIVVSSVLFDGDVVLDAGKCYVFNRVGGLWEFFQTLQAEDLAIGRQFGWSLSLDDDGLAIGAPVVSQIYIFEFIDNRWNRVDQLIPGPSRVAYDLFGTSVLLQNDVIVGGGTTSGESGFAQSGAVYVFENAE